MTIYRIGLIDSPYFDDEVYETEEEAIAAATEEACYIDAPTYGVWELSGDDDVEIICIIHEGREFTP